MKVLVACEFSNTVRDAFLDRGHDAYSCDLQRADHPNINWRRHIQGDVRPLLRQKWDLVIAHPPCTYLSVISNCLRKKGVPFEEDSRYIPCLEGCLFFMDCLDANASLVCVENPIPGVAKKYLPSYTQKIQPWQFGHPYTKATCLWLKGLPPLEPTNIVVPVCGDWTGSRPGCKGGQTRHRDSNFRSRTFPGIARAMAQQWGDL